LSNLPTKDYSCGAKTQPLQFEIAREAFGCMGTDILGLLLANAASKILE
jgi:hypothetical protein